MCPFDEFQVNWLKLVFARCVNPLAPFLPFAVTLLWALHPLNTAAVNYPTQRTEIAVGLFLFSCLYGLHKSIWVAPARKRVSILWLLFSVVACLLGMGSKESMMAAPILALAYDRIFLASSWKEVFRSRGWFYALLFLTWAWPVQRHIAYAEQMQTWESQTRMMCIMTQIWGLARMVRLIFWPAPLIFDYGVFLFSRLGDIWQAGLLLITLGLGTLWGLLRSPKIGFCGLCFFAILAPATLFPIYGQPIAEHRMIAPLAFASVAIVVGLSKAIVRIPKLPPRMHPAFFCCGVMILGIALGWISHWRNQDYQIREKLYADTIAKHPINSRAWYGFGLTLAKSGRNEEALAAFERADHPAETPTEWTVDANLYSAFILADMQRFPEAFALLNRWRVAYPTYPKALLTLGRVHLLNQEPAIARIYLGMVDKQDAAAAEFAMLEMIRAYFESGVPVPQGINLQSPPQGPCVEIRTYADLLPYYAALYSNLDHFIAMSYFRRLARDNRENATILSDIAWILAVTDDVPSSPAEAISLAMRAAELTENNHPSTLDTLAAAYANAGLYEEAIACAIQARELALAQEKKELVKLLDRRIKKYRRGQPWREILKLSPQNKSLALRPLKHLSAE